MAVPIPLERDEVIIGRALEADVRLNDSRASRLHARISSDLDPKTNQPLCRSPILAPPMALLLMAN